MSCLKTQYFRLNRILLLAVGLWPYEQSIFVRLQLILLYSIVTSSIIFQFTAFMTIKFTPQIVIEIGSSILFFILCIIQYNAFTFNLNIVKNLLELLQHIYDELRDESEIVIIKRYWIFARRYAGALTLLALLAFPVPSIVPHVVNTASLTNDSQFSLHIVTEYFIDKERYSYLILLHTNAAFCIAVTAILATGLMIIMYFQHACGMFKIASYRIEQAMMRINLKTNSTKNTNMVYTGIVYAVDMHRKAMGFVNLLMSAINISMALFAVTSVTCASLNLFRIFQEVNSGCDIKKLLFPILFLSIIYLYLFFANDMSQQIMDHNNDIFVTAYNVKWYLAPLHIQKLILFLLQRGTKNFHLLIAGMFVGCLEGFATLTTSSVSYFTVIYSTSQS